MAPSATARPRSMITKLRATRRANGSFCSTSSTVSFSSLRRKMMSPISLHDVGLNALGRLVEDEQLRFQRQRAADGELLLLPAREIAAAPAQHLLQHREQLEDALGDRARFACRATQPDAQVLLDGRAAGRSRGPAARSRCRRARARSAGRAASSVPSKRDLARGRRQQAHDHLEERGLADAVAAHQAGAAALGDVEVDVPEGVAARRRTD